MPRRESFLGGLDVVGYYRTGPTAVINFHHGPHSVAVTAVLTTVASEDGGPWFKAQCEFQVRPLQDVVATWAERGQIEGYGRTEDEALLAAVNLFLDRLDVSTRGGRSRP